MHDETQSCLSFRLSDQSARRRRFSYRDALGNWVHQFNILPEHTPADAYRPNRWCWPTKFRQSRVGCALGELEAASRGTDGRVLRHAGAQQHTCHHLANPGAADQRRSRRAAAERVAGFAQSASDLIHERFEYVKGATHVNSSIADSLQVGAGVCQDFAHLLLGVLRKRGIPARYVSGYLVPQNENNPAAKLEEVIGGQASHAWAEAYIPDSGWVPLDPTLGKPVGMRHVRVAYGRDYADVAPVRGVYKGHAGQRLSVDVSVRPAIDDEGNERMAETTAIPSEPEPVEPRAQQGGQQQ